MSDSIVHVTDASFEAEVLNADGPVLVDFWAEWCGPCKMIAPVLDELAGEYEGKIKICKMDVDANQGTPGKFNIRGIPTLIIFKGGAADATKVGALSKAQLVEFIDASLKGPEGEAKPPHSLDFPSGGCNFAHLGFTRYTAPKQLMV